jgi:hypothetical protein
VAFSFGSLTLGSQTPFGGSAAGFTILKTTFCGGFAALLIGDAPARLQFVAEMGTGNMAVEVAGTFLLAFDLNAAGEVFHIDAGGGLIDFLPPGTGASDKAFDQVALPDAQLRHPFEQLWVHVHGSRDKLTYCLKKRQKRRQPS